MVKKKAAAPKVTKKHIKQHLAKKKAEKIAKALNPDNWVSYETACKFGRSLGLTSYKMWTDYTQVTELPDGIPKTPHRVYEGVFKTVEFLNSKKHAKKATKLKHKQLELAKKKSNITKNGFLEFEQARGFVHALALSSSIIYAEWVDNHGEDHPEIPPRPHRTYHANWQGWADFLGIDAVATHFTDKGYCVYLDAKKFVHGLGLKNATEWREWCKLNPAARLDVPRRPKKVYADNWESWDKFLGTDILDAIATRKAAVPVLYIAQEPDTPGNVYTVAFEQKGQGAVYDKAVLQKKGKIIRLYEFDNDMIEIHLSRMDAIKQVVNYNSTQYMYGRENQRIVPNIHQLLWDLQSYCDQVPIKIPKPVLTKLLAEANPHKTKATATANAAMFDKMQNL